ncbi:MucR family transcriptional regulator [Nostoc sp. 3335mG]|nr:MucR family transcriptional regulator [Nostoc sp. 3335mG]
MNEELLQLTADIVSAHVGNNHVSAADVPTLIQSTYAALEQANAPAAPEAAAPEPAVSIRASIKPDYIVCLEDGKKLTMLKRYLRTNFNMSPEEYRAKWNLPRDYPMVAPNYADKRRTLAKTIGLGRKAKETVTAAAASATKTVKTATATAAKKAAPAVKAAAEPVAAAAKAPRKKIGIAAAKAKAVAHLGGNDANTAAPAAASEVPEAKSE